MPDTTSACDESALPPHPKSSQPYPRSLTSSLLGPDGSPVIARVERDFGAEPVVKSVAVACTRADIEQAAAALDSDTVICTDGDVVSVWSASAAGVRLIDAVPIGGTDDRTLEVVAARAMMSARDGHAPNTANGTMTILANPVAEPMPPQVVVAHEAPPPAKPEPRIAPRAVISAGPGLFASVDGTSAGFQLQADIGVGRFIAITPWVGIVPAPRHITNQPAAVGTAEYRPTLIGCGINLPLLGPSSVIVPRLGVGYALLWVHTWPDAVGPSGIANESEDLFAPVMYVSGAISVRVAGPFRVVIDGMLGTATAQVDVRLAGNTGARWGVPLESAGLRAEYVLP